MATYSSTEPAARLRVFVPHHERSASSVESCLRVSLRQSPSIWPTARTVSLLWSLFPVAARGHQRFPTACCGNWPGHRSSGKAIGSDWSTKSTSSMPYRAGASPRPTMLSITTAFFMTSKIAFCGKIGRANCVHGFSGHPSNWFRLLSPYFGRAHIFAELLDEALFNGATFNDLLSSDQRPIIFLHASDMATVSRFEFNQRQFDLICSDLSKLPLSVATASSAALPLAPQSHFVEELRRAVRIRTPAVPDSGETDLGGPEAPERVAVVSRC